MKNLTRDKLARDFFDRWRQASFLSTAKKCYPRYSPAKDSLQMTNEKPNLTMGSLSNIYMG